MAPYCVRWLVATLLILAGLGLDAGTVSAQQPARSRAPAHFCGPLTQSPMAPNGYEELVRAGELVRSSKLFVRAGEGGATLALKRQALLDRPVIRALALLRQGLARQVFTLPETHSPSLVFSDFAAFRSLARLLQLQQYVFLADGRVPDALVNARLGLRLGRAVHADTLISGLVGIAISSMCIHSLGAHLDQLGARDSELLYQVCLEWLNQPNPLLRVVEGERQLAKQKLAGYKTQGASAQNEAPASESDQERGLTAELKSLRTASAADYDTMLREAEKQIDALFDRQLAELTKPVRERPPEGDTSDKGLAARIAASLMPLLTSVVSLYQREEAQVRLLACHSAILRYRWEQDRLPAALSVLNLGSLASDPFTGLPLHYEIHGRTYRLASAGSPTGPDDPGAVNGRRPIFIVPEE